MMIKVKLLAHTDADPLVLASHAAKVCYQSEMPEFGKLLDVKKRLFDVGHHTTLQHTYFTFAIEGISVGDITLGMHLAHPFYNSDQRSGRYCAKMFEEPDFVEIEKYVRQFWPQVKGEQRKKVMRYVRNAVAMYNKNIVAAREKSKVFLKAERPYVNEGYIEQNSPKIAQEQTRMFIPVIFPTAFDYTINLTALVAMYESAWTPAMRYVTEKMVEAVLEKFPELSFMFNPEKRRRDEWALELPKKSSIKISKKPKLKLLNIIGEKDFSMPESKDMHPVDHLHFKPEYMDNSFGAILTEIELSLATMGQDQRHRTIGRSKPRFTGNFYLPPILTSMGLQKDAIGLMEEWIKISREIPATLAMIIAPYGAMVKYRKRGSFNAVAHEQGKRLCWCAQEEIYQACKLLRKAAIEKSKGKNSKLLKMLEPPCYRTGRCAEGNRYCGRDMKLRKRGDYFPERKV